MKLRVLHLGRIDCQRLHLVACPDESTMIASPMVALLIEHPTLGNILYDTGNSPFYNSVYGKAILETYPITQFRSIEDALADAGLRPDDIDLLILSHLHFDHAGGLSYFAGTKAFGNIIVAESELKNAYFSVMTGQSGAYVKSLFDLPDVRYRTISQDTKLADDLTLFLQASHTPGVIGLQLTLPQTGTVLVTSDTIYTQDSYDQGLPPGGKINKTQDEFFSNLEAIRQRQAVHQATLFFGHDYDQVTSWAARGWIE